jgi:hypothetical protein
MGIAVSALPTLEAAVQLSSRKSLQEPRVQCISPARHSLSTQWQKRQQLPLITRRSLYPDPPRQNKTKMQQQCNPPVALKLTTTPVQEPIVTQNIPLLLLEAPTLGTLPATARFRLNSSRIHKRTPLLTRRRI